MTDSVDFSKVRKEYRKLDKLQQVDSDRIFDTRETSIYDRYSDIKTYADTRVCLKPRANLTNDYINACYVDSPIAGQSIIAAQGPLSNTVEDFWRMVSDENATMIVTTCKLREDGMAKCEKFWPDADKDLSFDSHMNVRHVESEQLTKHLKRNVFHLYDPIAPINPLPITQLHYTGWPDHGVPSENSIEDFSSMLDLFIDHLVAEEKAIVHCSAGVGRTGTTIALSHLIVNLWAQKN